MAHIQINKLRPEDLNCNIFSVYDYDGCSLQELLCHFFHKINECIEVSANTADMVEWLKNEGLKQEVAEQLKKWLADGTLADIITKDVLHNINRRLEILEKYAVEVGERLETEHDDTFALERAFQRVMDGGIVYVTRPLTLVHPIDIDKSVTLEGRNYEITIDAPINNVLVFSGKQTNIMDCNFKNTKGRSVVVIAHADKALVQGCTFTGYNIAGGYYATDSAVRFDDEVDHATVRNCTFHDVGHNYGHSNLNRCITLNNKTIHVGLIENCIFTRFNQGIVSNAPQLTIRNCKFDNCRDNSIYAVADDLVVDGNVFLNHEDEPIVLTGSAGRIVNNTFREISNKAIGVNQGMDSLVVDGNTMINATAQSGQFLSYRPPINKATKYISITNNTVLIKSTYTEDIISEYIWVPIAETTRFTGNTIEVTEPKGSRNIISFQSDVLYCNHNTVKSSTSTVRNALSNTGNTLSDIGKDNHKSYIEDNVVINATYGIARNMIGDEINPTAYKRQYGEHKILFCEGQPSQDFYNVGDIIFNTTAGATPTGWICKTKNILTPFTLG